MIKFENWHIANQGELLGRQFDNLTRELRVEGDIPEGWTWDLLIQAGKNLDVISLAQFGDALRVTLTAKMLALDGYYAIQLRGAQGEKVRHTNVLQVYVPESLSGDAQWPELPSEFSQAEAAIRELNTHPPIPGSGGFWMLWNTDTDRYEPSDLPLPSGGPGGYYTPAVTQPNETTMQVAYGASDASMPAVPPVQVTLPRGPSGISPKVTVEQTTGGVTVKITDATGTTTAEVKNGKDGNPGSPGKTPEKGMDYWTAADKSEIVADTIAALPVYNGEVQGGA